MALETARDIYWRSLLFVPANNLRFAEKASRCSADAIVLDLEDAVLAEQKVEARLGIRKVAESLSNGKCDVLVRINRPLSFAVPDIEAAVCKHVDGIMVAKAAGAEHLKLLGEILEEREKALGLPQGHTKLVPLIETPEAVGRLDEIATSPRVVAIVCGDEDLAADLGCNPESEPLIAIKHRLVLSAALAGIRPLGLLGSIAEFRDLEKYQSLVRRSRAAGLKGTLCIHPNQIDVANQGFGPSREEVEYATQVVEAAASARQNGAAAVGLEGKMIDAPVLRRAENLLNAVARSKGSSKP